VLGVIMFPGVALGGLLHPRVGPYWSHRSSP